MSIDYRNKYDTIVFGGTFDPFTIAHETIVKAAIDKFDPMQLIIAPSITNWYRDANDVWLCDRERLIVCNCFVDRIKKHTHCDIIVRDKEINTKLCLSGPAREAYVQNSHFFDTLIDIYTSNTIHDIQPKIGVIIGSDQLERFKTWHNWEQILQLCSLIVVNDRNGIHIESDIPHDDLEIDKKYQYVSATKIREKYKNHAKSFSLRDYLQQSFLDEPEEVVYHSPIWDVVSKPDEHGIGFRPDGINSPDWAAIIVEKDGKYLMVKQLRYGLMKEFEEFPCGMIEKNENAIYAAKRELHEETGIHLTKGVDDLLYLGKFAANPAFMNNYMHYFYVNLDKAEYIEENQHLDEHEKLEVYWKDKREVLKDWFDGSSVFFAGAMLKLKQKNLI